MSSVEWKPHCGAERGSERHVSSLLIHQTDTSAQHFLTNYEQVAVEVHTRLLFYIKSSEYMYNNVKYNVEFITVSSNTQKYCKHVCLCVCLCAIQGRTPRFNIISLCERGSTISLIKNRQHEEAIWRCAMREDRLSVLWPNKCFHSIKAIRPVWSGLVGMLSLPRSIDYRQLSALSGPGGKTLPGTEPLALCYTWSCVQLIKENTMRLLNEAVLH